MKDINMSYSILLNKIGHFHPDSQDLSSWNWLTILWTVVVIQQLQVGTTKNLMFF